MQPVSKVQPSEVNTLTIYDTDNTNSRHLELYTILGEYNNTGFPLSYCLLTTASSVELRKRTQALEAWAAALRDEYGVKPRFVHTDKDMAEIGASRRVWPEAKHQLCWWHQREAVRRRLKGNLPTSIYNPPRAKREHGFIDINFRPYGRTDPNDIEGNVPGEVCEQETQSKAIPLTSNDPNSIKLRIPVLSSQGTQRDHASTRTLSNYYPDPIWCRMSPLTGSGLGLQGTDCTPVTGSGPGTVAPTPHTNMPKLMIRICAPMASRETVMVGDEPDEEITNERHTFCPIEYRTMVVDMMERHFCAHPLIPGYSALTPEGIKAWAVKQAYEFCLHRDLPNLWAYLWENWYRRGRWELWARSGNPKEIPRLKTKMFVEGQ